MITFYIWLFFICHLVLSLIVGSRHALLTAQTIFLMATLNAPVCCGLGAQNILIMSLIASSISFVFYLDSIDAKDIDTPQLVGLRCPHAAHYLESGPYKKRRDFYRCGVSYRNEGTAINLPIIFVFNPIALNNHYMFLEEFSMLSIAHS